MTENKANTLREAQTANNYEELANMIILTAVRDYKKALRRIKKKPDDASAKHYIYECEQFFRSEWYMVLSDLNGEFIIRKFREEILGNEKNT